jgi:hypothetical protein
MKPQRDLTNTAALCFIYCCLFDQKRGRVELLIVVSCAWAAPGHFYPQARGPTPTPKIAWLRAP